jgi:hypothetical protein
LLEVCGGDVRILFPIFHRSLVASFTSEEGLERRRGRRRRGAAREEAVDGGVGERAAGVSESGAEDDLHDLHDLHDAPRNKTLYFRYREGHPPCLDCRWVGGHLCCEARGRPAAASRAGRRRPAGRGGGARGPADEGGCRDGGGHCFVTRCCREIVVETLFFFK